MRSSPPFAIVIEYRCICAPVINYRSAPFLDGAVPLFCILIFANEWLWSIARLVSAFYLWLLDLDFNDVCATVIVGGFNYIVGEREQIIVTLLIKGRERVGEDNDECMWIYVICAAGEKNYMLRETSERPLVSRSIGNSLTVGFLSYVVNWFACDVFSFFNGDIVRSGGKRCC